MYPRTRANRTPAGDEHPSPAYAHAGAPAHAYTNIATACDARVNAHVYGRSHP